MSWVRRLLGREKQLPMGRRPPGEQPLAGSSRFDRPGPQTGEEPFAGRRYERGEMPVVTDGQLGDSARGVEGINPEGSVDISNSDYWRNEQGAKRTGQPVPRRTQS